MCTRICNSICCTVYYQRWSHCAILGADYDEGHVYKIYPVIANTQWLTDRPFDLTSCQTAHYLRRVTGGWLLTRTSWAAEDTLPDLNSVALYGPQCKVHIKLQVQSNVTGLLHVRTSTPQSCKIRQSHAGASRLSGSCPDSAHGRSVDCTRLKSGQTFSSGCQAAAL